jgi:putative thiamine transport system ATP-binding protein
MTSNTQIKLQDVQILLDGQMLITISETINPGEVLTVMGPSGSGKSTLLAHIGGFLDPAFSAMGKVLLNGEDITLLAAEQRRVGILFQDPLLFPHMSVGGNLMFAIPAKIKGKEIRKKLANQALEQAGLNGFFDRDPATLSGGQKARVALMRVLMGEPRALLLDEPFSKLDTERRAQIRQFVLDEARARNLPVLMVTHDHADAKAAGGSVFTL